jgi:hypothetical protein
VTAVLASEPYSSRHLREQEEAESSDEEEDDEMREFATSLLYGSINTVYHHIFNVWCF